MLAILGRSSDQQRQEWSAALCGHLMAANAWVSGARVVSLFAGLRTEADLFPLIPWLHGQGVKAALFAMDGEALTPYCVSGNHDLVRGPIGVLEPRRDASKRLTMADIDVALIPGLAFGANDGARLGRGRGYFDRALGAPDCRAFRIGVGFGIQFLPSVPVSTFDVPMNALASEEGLKILLG
jgi:5-formyltetrahydrofolate cyclo-ligase